jgi:hypothetical protein
VPSLLLHGSNCLLGQLHRGGIIRCPMALLPEEPIVHCTAKAEAVAVQINESVSIPTIG